MQWKRLTDGPPREWAVVLDTGERFLETFTTWAADNAVHAASFTAIGAFQEATLGWYDLDRRRYAEIPVPEQVEVLTLAGDVTDSPEGEPFVHAHACCARHDGTTVGGHVRSAVVRPTLEIVVTQTTTHVRRRPDQRTGLALIDLDASGVATR